MIDKTKIIDMNRGKLPPQAIDLEQAIIGAMLIDSKSVDECLSIIPRPEVFYKDTHAVVFEAIQQLHNEGNPIDLLTVSSKLKLNGKLELAGGDFYLIQLTQKISSGAHIEYHSRIVLQKFISRQTIMFSELIINLAYDDTTDIFELLQRWQNEFDKVTDFISTGRTTVSFPTALDNLLKEVELLTSNKQEVKLVGVNTGFKSINKYTGGYRNQDLVIVAARPSMGKTAYVLKTAIEVCKLGAGVGFISLEMSMAQLTARSVAIDTNFHLGQLLKKGFEHNEYFQTYRNHQDRMSKYSFHVDDSGKTDITDVVITAKLWKRKYDIKLLIVDYLQLITDKSSKGNREHEIGNISRRLKRLAKELEIPVIALAQLSRAVESRPNKRPMLSDLRESGSIEQDADIVQFLYRSSYYKIDIDIEYYDDLLKPLIEAGADTEIIFAKYRGGSVGTTMLKFIGDKTKFVDVMDEDDKVDYINESYTELPKPTVTEAFDSDNQVNDELPDWLKEE